MFAVDHSATALLIKRRFPSVSMTPLLVSVQAMELAWVVLNYVGVEQTTTAATVRSVADIHLTYIAYSHSVATVTAAALVAWWAIERGLGRRAVGRAVAIGIVSHLVLDIATHAPDIALWPGSPFGRLGLGLYSGAPPVAFVVELMYGVLCWWIYRGSRALLWVVVAGNLADISFFFAGIPGPEQFLAGHPMLVVTLILGQMVTMLVLVGLFSSKPALPSGVENGPGSTRMGLPSLARRMMSETATETARRCTESPWNQRSVGSGLDKTWATKFHGM